MGKSSSAPKAPDPKATAAAQTSTNVSTAIANSVLGNVNQVTPDGSLTYTQTGQQFINDPNGQKYWYNPTTGQYSTSAPKGTTTQTVGASRGKPIGLDKNGNMIYSGGSKGQTVTTPGTSGWKQVNGYYVPTTTATQTLSPQQQAIKDQTDAAQLNLGKIANNQSAFLNDYLSKPLDLNNEAVEARLMELGRKRLDPMVAQRDEDLRTRLANQGIKSGSDAYARELETFNQGTNDAYNQLLLNGRQQAVQEALTERNQPINEIIGLLGGSQVSQPNWVQTNQPQIATTDYAGLVNQDYQNRLGAYQQQQAQTNGILGGLFGLGSSAIMASDKRVKRDIKPAGKLMGHNLHEYRYKGKFDDGKRHIGVMAQEVEKKRPDAVVDVGGVKHVNYGKLFELGKAA